MLPQRVGPQDRRELVAALRRVERAVENVLRLLTVDVAPLELHADGTVDVERLTTIELQVLPVAHRPLEGQEERARVVLPVVHVKLAAAALAVFAAVMVLLERGADDAAHVRLDALLLAELGEIVGERFLHERIACGRHRIDQNVAKMLPAIAE
eukprot:7379994-Prymnesium_polylepis.1